MGFYKKYVNYENTLIYLQKNKLKELYGKAESLIFLDDESENIHTLFYEGKNEEEILNIIQ
jgi:hypothetical protein